MSPTLKSGVMWAVCRVVLNEFIAYAVRLQPTISFNNSHDLWFTGLAAGEEE